jgi:hypothetical protein
MTGKVPAQAAFGFSCIPDYKKNKNVSEDPIVVKRSVQFIIDTHCVKRKLVITVNRLGELSLNYRTIQIGLSTANVFLTQHVIFPEKRLCSSTELFTQFSAVVIWIDTRHGNGIYLFSSVHTCCGARCKPGSFYGRKSTGA